MAEKLSVVEALDRIEAHVEPLAPRRISIDAAAVGHATAAALTARADTPRFDCSAMDGFALRAADTAEARPDAPLPLPLAAGIRAESAAQPLPPHTAAPISTGAMVPAGADTVIAREFCRAAGGRLFVGETLAAGANIRRRGEDVAAGAVVLPAATCLNAAHIGALRACGVEEADLRSPPRIAILVSGSELAAAGGPGARLDCNGPMIGAMCKALGLGHCLRGPVDDEPEAIESELAALVAAPGSDMLLSTGGVSVGEHDLVRRALERLGAHILFHGIAMRPGKPLLFAQLPDGRPFIGLPGNPVAALVGFRFFAFAAIRRLMGLSREVGERIDPPAAARAGTTLFLRGTRRAGGALVAADQRSHVMRSVIASDCWVRLDPEEQEASTHLFDLLPSLAN